MSARHDARLVLARETSHARRIVPHRDRLRQPSGGLSLGGALAIGMLCGSALALVYFWRQRRQRQDAFRALLHSTGVIPEELLPALPDLAPASAEADEALAARVCEAIARVASHPDLIRVSAERGHVLLRGAVPVPELKPLLRAVAGVYGVQTVESRLKPRDEATSA